MKLSKNKIYVILARKQINVKELAKMCGMSRAAFYTMINTKSNKTLTVGKMAAALGVDVTEIIE